MRTSGQDGGWVDMFHLLVEQQRELQLNLKTINNQNCQEIKMYLPNNHRFKEATFFQTGTRGRDMKTGRESRRCSVVWRRSGDGKNGPTIKCSA